MNDISMMCSEMETESKLEPQLLHPTSSSSSTEEVISVKRQLENNCLSLKHRRKRSRVEYSLLSDHGISFRFQLSLDHGKPSMFIDLIDHTNLFDDDISSSGIDVDATHDDANNNSSETAGSLLQTSTDDEVFSNAKPSSLQPNGSIALLNTLSELVLAPSLASPPSNQFSLDTKNGIASAASSKRSCASCQRTSSHLRALHINVNSNVNAFTPSTLTQEHQSIDLCLGCSLVFSRHRLMCDSCAFIPRLHEKWMRTCTRCFDGCLVNS